MPEAAVHLAQVNVARLRQPIDHPATAAFVAGLEPVNALADGTTGFVWRLQTEDGDATALRVFPDPEIIVNLSVWTSVAALREFVYRSGHTPFLRRRAEWFERMDLPTVALWWVRAGHVPDVQEARSRLDFLAAHGPTPYAFGLRTVEPALLFERASLDDAAAAVLIAELDDELTTTYPEPGSNFFTLRADAVEPGRGALLVGRLDGQAVAVGALRLLAGESPEAVAELKRMYVRPQVRGRRIGAALVAALLDEARRFDVRRVVLETGVRQTAALALYRRLGFTEVPCWGEYAEAPPSRCLMRSLDVGDSREPSAPPRRTET